MADLNKLKDFDVQAATATLWVFKKSNSPDRGLRYTGRWIETMPDLDDAMKTAVSHERGRITETQEYGLLAENNDSSALSITKEETHAGLIVDAVSQELEARRVSKIKEISNSDFYVIKLVSNQGVLHAVKKTDSTWQTKKSIDKIAAYFSEDRLKIQEHPPFNLSKNVDFFILQDDIFVSHKSAFESVLNYKQAHMEDFAALQQEQEFISIFESLDAILDYVGNNKIQLRRACAIRQKGHYKDEGFMHNLRTKYHRFGLNIEFDEHGRIKPTPETCRDIFQALLDHRLRSGFSNNVYDVPDVSNVLIGN